MCRSVPAHSLKSSPCLFMRQKIYALNFGKALAAQSSSLSAVSRAAAAWCAGWTVEPCIAGDKRQRKESALAAALNSVDVIRRQDQAWHPVRAGASCYWAGGRRHG